MSNRMILAMTALLLSSAIARARAEEPDKPSPGVISQIQTLQEQAKNMGPWETEAGLLRDAHINIFQKNGWTGESDQFTLELMHQVTRIAPWNAAEREDVFLSGLQNRMNLTHDQRGLVAREMRLESMNVTMKHIKDVLPVALEIAQVRARQEPFTAEQVQKWSGKFKPLLSDALASVQKVAGKLDKTMTEEQRALLDKDMKALLKRHADVEKMVDNWQAGHWNPTEWGLDNDPIHAAAMYEYRLKEAAKDGLVNLALSKEKPDVVATAKDKSAWRLYVEWFCNFYTCDDQQRATAEGILTSSLKRATNFLQARGQEIGKAEQLRDAAQTDAQREIHAAELARLQQPLEDIFKELCARLEANVLTTRQRKLLPPKQPAAKTAAAAPKPPADAKITANN